MKKSTLASDGLLILTAAIWGLAFVAQRVGMDHLGPYAFNAIRFFVGACSLLPVIVWLRRRESGGSVVISRSLILGGMAMGVLLFAGASLQQVGLLYTTAGNAGFITGLYIVLVPVIGLLWGQKTGLNTWLGMVLAMAGLYLLTMHGDVTLNKGDMLMLIGALFWALHVLLIGWLAPRHSGLLLAVIQFLTCSGLSLAVALPTEEITVTGVKGAWAAIVFAGVMSTGVAYTLQIIAQKNAPAAHASIILSLEAVFAVLGGWLLLDEIVTLQTLAGCAVMLSGMLLSQINIRLLRRWLGKTPAASSAG